VRVPAHAVHPPAPPPADRSRRFRRHQPPWGRPPVHRPRLCGGQRPLPVGISRCRQAAEFPVPPRARPPTVAPLLAGSSGAKNQAVLVAQCPYPSGSARRPGGGRGHGASLLSATLLPGRHRPPTAHCTAHTPAHRRASKCQVRSRFFLTCSARSLSTSVRHVSQEIAEAPPMGRWAC
jgi:hypothetical protein